MVDADLTHMLAVSRAVVVGPGWRKKARNRNSHFTQWWRILTLNSLTRHFESPHTGIALAGGVPNTVYGISTGKQVPTHFYFCKFSRLGRSGIYLALS